MRALVPRLPGRADSRTAHAAGRGRTCHRRRQPRRDRRDTAPLADHHNAFVYVYRGELGIAGQTLAQQRLAILANTPGSDGVRLQGGPQGARAILVAGQPLHEPIAQYGPFVMNSKQEIMQAVEDFRAGRLA